MVKMRAGILEVEDATSALAKLQVCLDQFVSDEEERQWILPHLAHLLGLADAPSSNRDEIFSAWRMFFERIAELGTTVLIFEDLQWADAGLIDFVESILEWSKGCSLLIVTLARPELMDKRPSWGAGMRNFTSLHLEPLSASSMSELLNGFVHGLPSEVSERVLQRAEGVPLYAVETIRMLVDRGVIVQVDDRYEVQAELGTLEIPETLHALIASRLDSLTPRQRTLLQDAGIIGSTFSIESLQVVSDESVQDLETELRDLVRKEYIFADNDPRSPERGQYGFVQGVIREVAVGTLARRDRQAKHVAVARYAESLGEEELTGVIAAHYIEAYRASPDEVGNEELLPKALEWLDRAGQRALSLGSPDEAAEMFDQAIALAPDDSALAPLLERAGEAATRRQHYESAIEYLQKAIDIYHARGDLVSWGLCISELTFPQQAIGRVSESIELSERAFELVGEDETRVRAKLALAIASGLGFGTEVQRAVEWCEIALRLAEELDDDKILAGALGVRSLALFTMGRHREAVMLARGMASIADDAGELIEQSRARTGLSLYMLPDNPRGMVDVANDAVELARRAGSRGLEITNMLNITETSLYLGLWDEAFAMIEQLHQRELPQWHREWLAGLEAVFAALGGDSARAGELLASGSDSGDSSLGSLTTRLTTVAFVALANGKLDDALRAANQAVELDPMGINCASALGIAARASLWTGNLDELRGVFVAMHRIRGRAMAAQRRTAEAGIAALEGRIAESAEFYQDAIERWRAVESVLDLALCELDLALVLGKDHEEATAAKEALDIFVQIGARVFVERLSEIIDTSTD
jgi:tetratricopeptide (TPR) repeat protein